MRVKNLIALSAMTALFAACAEDFDVASNAGVNQENRPSAGKVTLNFTENALTKAWDDDLLKQKFEPGERIGAMLMDIWDGKGNGIEHYAFIDYVHTNYPFSYDGNVWSTPDNAPVSEGNYFFTYPYVPTFHDRGYVIYEVPSKQYNVDLETGEYNLWQSVEENQAYLGYSFVGATTDDVNTVDATLWPIFAAPKFSLVNETPGTLKLIKLIIRAPKNEDNDLNLMPSKVAVAPLTEKFGQVAKAYPNQPEKQVEYLVNNALIAQNGFLAPEKTASALETEQDKGYYEYTIEFGDNYTRTYDQAFRACAVMPAGNYEDLEVYALVEKVGGEDTEGGCGFVKFSTLNEATWNSDGQEQGAGHVNLMPNKTQVFTAQFSPDAVRDLGWHNFTVVDSEDLAWILALKAEYGGSDDVVVKTQGDKVVLTKEVYDLLKDKKRNTKLQIDGIIVIPENVPNDAIDLLVTNSDKETTIINEGVQTLTKDVTADIINRGTLNSSATINGDLTVEEGVANVTVVQSGVVTVNEGAEATIDEAAVTVVNNGTLYTQGVIYWQVTNNGEWFVIGNQVLKGDGGKNYGKMTVRNNVTVQTNTDKDHYFRNQEGGVIYNYGTLGRVFENRGTIYNGNESDLEATLNCGGNYAEIHNYSTIEGMFGNYTNAIIYMKVGTAEVHFTGTDNGDGNIENTLHGDIENIGDQHVIYTASNQDFATVIFDMKTYGKYTDLVIVGEYTLTDEHDISQPTTSETVKAITVDKTGVVNIDYNQDVQLGGEYISLTNNGKVSVMHGATLRVGSVDNNGTFKVNNNAKVLDADGNDTTDSIEGIERFD